jgi:feruloyl esterase
MRPRSYALAAAALLALPAPGVLLADAACDALTAVTLPHTTISAQSVGEGTFTPPYGSPLDRLPAFCRAAGVIRPSSDSYIRFEVWLPTSGWNGRFLAAGNGGFAGAVDYNALARNLRRGYATAATDTGHEGDATDASWAFKHPEKIVDFGYRALHETNVNAKSLIQAFYSRPAAHSYFESCSDGGREALMEAQRFPEDFDGILAGAPANYWTHMVAGGVDLVQALYGRDPSAYISKRQDPRHQCRRAGGL